MAILGGIGGGLGAGFGSYFIRNYGWESILFLILGFSVLITLMMWLFLSLQPAKAEQGGTEQPATRPESKSEGSDKPQPEAEGRSQ